MGAQDLLLRILAKNETKAAFSEVKSGLSSLTGALAGFGIGLSALGVAKFSAEAIQLAASAGPVENAFNSMAASLGRNADSMLADLQSISRGAIDQTALMTAANTAMLLGGRTLASELPTLLEVARAGSIALGQDMQFMFQSIITGIARQSPLILDNLGIVVDLETANRNYAASLGITVEAMSEAQKQQALLNDILRVAPDYIASVGADSVTAAEQLRSLTAASTELKTAWGELLLQAGVGNAISGIAGFVAGQTDVIRDFGDFLAMSAEFAAAGMDEEAEAAQKAAEAVRRMGSDTANSLPWVKALSGQYEVMTKLTKPVEAGVRATANAIARSILPTMQWADALAAMNMELAKTAMTGIGAMSQAGPISPLLQNQSTFPDTLDEWVAGMLDANDTMSGDTKETARNVLGTWESTFDSVRSMAENALMARSQPTELDFLQTGLGQYQDAPLESVRRLDAIIQRGFSELSAHPDWAALLEIPADVLSGGEDALRAWAIQTRDSVANLARPDLINWDAFVAEFARQKEEATAKALTLDIAVGKLAQAGLLAPGNEASAKMQIAQMLGLDTPEIAAASIAQGFQTAFDANNPASALLSSFQTKLGTQETAYKTTGEKAGGWLGDSIKGAALTSLDGFLPDLAARLSPYLVLPGGSPPP